MSADKPKFEPALFGKNLDACTERFENVLRAHCPSDADKAIGALTTQLAQHRDRGHITVAFVGQYSAGKSTTISALTDRRDIEIDSDIATDSVSEYEWHRVRLIDTPGLYTEREDHDQIAYEALRAADLVVYTLTYTLFDSVTNADFHRLAFERGYQRKMLIAVNKFNDESGPAEERIQAYRKSLQAALSPHLLDDFPLCFIDAKDYIDGINDDEPELVEESRFSTFVEGLSSFIRERGALGHLDAPARILLDHVERAEQRLRREDGEDDAYTEQLHQLARRSRLHRERLRGKVRELCLNLASAVNQEGSGVVARLSEERDIEAAVQASQAHIQKRCETTTVDMQAGVRSTIAELQDDFREVLSGPLAESFVSPLLATEAKIAADLPVQDNTDIERLRMQGRRLAEIGQRVGVKVTEMAIGRGGHAAGLLLRPGQVAGGPVHGIVLKVGHQIGIKFKPWQAVNMAAKIGNVAKWIGPIAAGLGLVLEIAAAWKESKQAKTAAEARVNVHAEYGKIADELDQQFMGRLREIETDTFDVVDADIAKARRQYDAEAQATWGTHAELASIRRDIEELLSQLR